jgi:peptidoglycan hydrolase-like protein with peptidoglycan-binding domain
MLDAFTGLPAAPAQHPAESPATPLSELLKQADALHDVHAAASKAVSKAKAKAVSKAKSKGKKLLKGVLHAPAVGPPAPAQESVSVASLQTALVKRGYNVARDGLYGPKTAAAWKSAANANHLSPMISRVGPKTARVANHTFDVLSVPAIP